VRTVISLLTNKC